MAQQRERRARIGQETAAILERREYQAADGSGVVKLDAAINSMLERTVWYRAERDVHAMASAAREATDHNTIVEVTNETTLAAVRRLVAADADARVLALNFASAKNPGGGFLRGAQAQEASIARQSTLYASLVRQTQFYSVNERCRTCLYTDNILYTPDVSIIRDDNDNLLAVPFAASFITSPAVNTGALQRNEPAAVDKIEATMLSRMARILDIALIHNHDTLVLGAWGCGVFANSPRNVADWFARMITRANAPYRNKFRRVTFAIYDPTGVALTAFRDRFQ